MGLLPSPTQAEGPVSRARVGIKPGPQGGERTTDHLAKEFLGGIAEEGHAAHQEFIEDDAHGPPVHWLPVALAEDHLGGDVLRRPANLGRVGQGN